MRTSEAVLWLEFLEKKKNKSAVNVREKCAEAIMDMWQTGVMYPWFYNMAIPPKHLLLNESICNNAIPPKHLFFNESTMPL
eukprot:3734899-Prymnesium_polylepis.1